MKPRLQIRYENEILAQLKQDLGRDNVLSLPRLEKVVINMGVGSAVQDKKYVEDAAESLTALAGQKCVVTRARKSIANFRLREGMPIGAMVTLRKARMYEFMDRLINLVLPRVRDFRGVSFKAFDGRGNYSLGLTERLVFPEVNPDKFTRPQGMNIVIVTSTPVDAEAYRLLELFGMPFRAKTKKSEPVA
ncbi:MAG: 50S ribosomal protein L5 [Pirellulaceae bacterium]|nr:50S ribosomal protein L5 [Planctomycetales bacterium]